MTSTHPTSADGIDSRAQRILLVEDHDIIVQAVESTAGFDGAPLIGPADPFPELATPPKGTGNFKWIRDPQVATQFLEQESDLGRWIPDYILVDFSYQGTPYSGLSVLAAAHDFAPAATQVVFSGHSSSNGRSLFSAAAFHWFGVALDVTKTDARRELPAVFSTDPSKQPRVNVRVRTHAKLVDAFFAAPGYVDLLRTWSETGGQDKAIMDRIHVSKRTAARYKAALAQAAAAFEAQFNVNPAPRLSDQASLKEYLGQFVTNNQPFFGDPDLPRIVDRVRPWERATTS